MIHKIIGKWTPNPDYAGNNITFGPLTIDEQIENLKAFHARCLNKLEQEYANRRTGIMYNYHLEMARLLEEKAAQESSKE